MTSDQKFDRKFTLKTNGSYSSLTSLILKWERKQISMQLMNIFSSFNCILQATGKLKDMVFQRYSYPSRKDSRLQILFFKTIQETCWITEGVPSQLKEQSQVLIDSCTEKFWSWMIKILTRFNIFFKKSKKNVSLNVGVLAYG